MTSAPRSLLSTNVHCVDRMTANDSRVGRGGLSCEGLVGTSENGWKPSRGFLNRLRSAPRAPRPYLMRAARLARDNCRLCLSGSPLAGSHFGSTQAELCSGWAVVGARKELATGPRAMIKASGANRISTIAAYQQLARLSCVGQQLPLRCSDKRNTCCVSRHAT